jgi:hypothetical protein
MANKELEKRLLDIYKDMSEEKREKVVIMAEIMVKSQEAARLDNGKRGFKSSIKRQYNRSCI